VAVEGDAALTDRNFGQSRAHLAVEAVAVHAEIGGRIAIANEAWWDPVKGFCLMYSHRETNGGPERAATKPMRAKRRVL
jgi:hypothetical protein